MQTYKARCLSIRFTVQYRQCGSFIWLIGSGSNIFLLLEIHAQVNTKIILFDIKIYELFRIF